MRILRAAALATAGVLLAFTLRRVILLAGAVKHSRQPRQRPGERVPGYRVIALIPCRNEAAGLPRLFEALDRLAYPRDQLIAVIVDDGSTDATAEVAHAWAAHRPWAQVVSLTKNLGKAQALNVALAQAGESSEIVVVYDADHRPAPESLMALVPAFDDPQVGGASGQMRVMNGEASPAAAYAGIESLVNQFVTMQGKDELGLAPALLGSNCAYRRSALDAVGGFTQGALLEDSDLSLALPLAGWRTRFVAESLSEHHAPLSLRGYAQQHLRWNRGFQQVIGGRLAELWRNPRLSLHLKLELTFFALGYADRLALLGAGLFTLVDVVRPGTFAFPRAVWAAYFGAPAAEMLAALALAGEPPKAFGRLAVVPFFFAFDLAMAVWSAAVGVLRRPIKWSQTERAS